MAGDGSTDEPPTTTILLNGYNLNSYLFTHRLAQHSDLGGEVFLCGEWKSITTSQRVSGVPSNKWGISVRLCLPRLRNPCRERAGRVLVQTSGMPGVSPGQDSQELTTAAIA